MGFAVNYNFNLKAFRSFMFFYEIRDPSFDLG